MTQVVVPSEFTRARANCIHLTEEEVKTLLKNDALVTVATKKAAAEKVKQQDVETMLENVYKLYVALHTITGGGLPQMLTAALSSQAAIYPQMEALAKVSPAAATKLIAEHKIFSCPADPLHLIATFVGKYAPKARGEYENFLREYEMDDVYYSNNGLPVSDHEWYKSDTHPIGYGDNYNRYGGNYTFTIEYMMICLSILVFVIICCCIVACLGMFGGIFVSKIYQSLTSKPRKIQKYSVIENEAMNDDNI